MEVGNTPGYEATPATGTSQTAANANPAPVEHDSQGKSSVSEREARPDTSASEESYTGTGKITAESWAEKAKKFKKPAEKKAAPSPAKKVEEAIKETVKGEQKTEKPAEEPQKEAPKAQDEAEQPADAAEGAKEETPKFEPVKTFKAWGKEHPVPEWAIPAMKDKESQDKFIQMFSQAEAFEPLKQRYVETTQELESVKGNHDELVGEIQEMQAIYAEAVQSGNLLGLDDFFAKMKISPQTILQYVAQKVQFEEMEDPIQKQRVLDHLQALRQNRSIGSQNQQLQQQAMQAQGRAMALELNAVLARPDIAPVVQAFDNSPGRKPGDFWARVREHGEYVHLKTGQLLSPEMAVQQVLAMYGQVPGAVQPAQPQAATTPTPQAAAPAAPQAPQAGAAKVPVAPAPHRNVPTIPPVSGKGGSPTKHGPRSIEDINRIRKEKFGG